MPTIQPRSIRASEAASLEPSGAIQSLKSIARSSGLQSGRFEIYELLEGVYRVYEDWKRQRVATRSARTLANEMEIVRRKGMSPIRILIEATVPDVDLKQKSRWVRSLEYLHSEKVPPSRFRKFVRSHGGLAGCARLAASVNRKRARPGGDWED